MNDRGRLLTAADAVCDTSCMGDTRPKRVPRWLTTDLVNWTREP